MAITETAAASSAAAEAADAAVHGPDLSMGTEHLTDAIADTTNYFVVFFEKLLEGLTWGNVLFQLCVIVVAVLAGLMCSKLVRSVVARHMPPHELKERFTQRMKRLALSVVNAIAFGLAYRSNFRGAYEMSASGRLSLAEHLRKLSLGSFEGIDINNRSNKADEFLWGIIIERIIEIINEKD